MTRRYDPDNIFSRILRGEIPCAKVYESDHTFAFKDIAPQAPVHILVIPKGQYIDYCDFSANASPTELVDFAQSVGLVAEAAGLPEDGYRLITNIGSNGGQEVPHYHVHVVGGIKLGPLLSCK